MRIYRNNLGRFETAEKADRYQDIENGKWSKVKKIEIGAPPKQYDEYEYHIGFDYETPANKYTRKLTSSGQLKTTDKHSHDFHTEFRITSPVKLDEHEIRQMILSKFSDYSNVLKEDAYNVHEDVNKVSRKPHLSSPTMSKVKRQ